MSALTRYRGNSLFSPAAVAGYAHNIHKGIKWYRENKETLGRLKRVAENAARSYKRNRVSARSITAADNKANPLLSTKEPRAGKMIRRRSSRRYRRRRSYGRSGGSVVTRQRDQAVTYRGRRRTRSSRGRRIFRSRVLQTVNSMQPMQVWTSKNAATGTSAANLQQVFGMGLFNTNATGQTDLVNLFNDAGIPTTTAGNRSGKIVIKSACLDVELKNNLTETIIMDVYTLLMVRDPEQNGDLNSQFQTFFNEMTTITAKSWNDPAVSVFENPDFCRHYKVLSKREVMLPADEIMTLQLRDGRDRTITGDQVIREAFGIPKVSKFYLFSWHGPPDPNAGGAGVPGLLNTSVTFTWQKAYKYAIMPGKQTGGVNNT